MSDDVTYYIAPGGNDGWSGLRPDPREADGPLASFEKALEKSRAHTGARRIVVRGGRYCDACIALLGEDAGLTIEAMAGETPELYGGRPITLWRREGDGPVWSANIPAGRSFRLLMVNGRTRERARLPEHGAFEHDSAFDVEWMSTTLGGWARNPLSKNSPPYG